LFINLHNFQGISIGGIMIAFVLPLASYATGVVIAYLLSVYVI
jgi:hypothetical protein